VVTVASLGCVLATVLALPGAQAQSLPASRPVVRPSVAVFALEAKTGVTAASAEAMTEYYVEELRRSSLFSKVVSTKDIQAVLGMEQQRQLMDCNATSCLTEIAQSLGVDFVAAGSVSKLGGSFLFTAKILNARSGMAAASLSRRVQGDTEEALLDVIRPAVEQMLVQMGAPPAAVVPPPESDPIPAPPASAPAPLAQVTKVTPPVDPEVTEKPTAPVLPLVVRAAGVAVMASVLLPVVVGVAASFLAAGSVGAVLVPGSDFYRVPMQVGFWSGVLVSVVSVLAGLVPVVAGAAVVGISFFLPQET
jgi:TolB-like protein